MTAIVELKDATVKVNNGFDTEKTILDHVNLTIREGDFITILGGNGAGKSTLMNILAGVFPADSGEVEFNEKKIRKMTIQQSEKLGIAFVHQELNLFNDLKVYENIFLMKEYKKNLN